ncbi:shikimate dehydrogenase [Desulfocicer vacuolatum DSM 3385]|uniref:Shikimate dehydrogenase (NADP(+)) n=1 Tax=Desulfocicer vacuolatum DSM 3385 TaxID=1121400 RepID=A0A1W1ZLC7_9BACT|nr:shikimate dehydrogenase [Desulfocicer vacuolatum]SMC49167.1 shikimate dehydrogenase [Desulfocicer vacuolatum DSM 3385]
MIPDTATDLYAVFGNPVAHSMGPLMHNTWFNTCRVNAVYMAFGIDDIRQGMAAMRTLNIKGASITIPFKEKILDYLDGVDPVAGEIGAVNTVVNRNGELWGYNTDCAGAVDPLKQIISLSGKTVYILGAGGAARAVAFGIAREKGRVVIVNRNEKRGNALADHVKGSFVPWEEFTGTHGDIIINTTPLGMVPAIHLSPVKGTALHMDTIVMDIVYNPLDTRLLCDARAAGCKTVDGLSMFIHQGVRQFCLFTGEEPPLELMRNTIIEALVHQ